MSKYVLKLVINHPGDFRNDRRTSKLNLIVEFDEERRKRDEPLFELENYAEIYDIPCSTLTLYVLSFKEEWLTNHRDVGYHFDYKVHDLENGGYRLEFHTKGDDVELRVGFPEPYDEWLPAFKSLNYRCFL